MKEVDDTLAEWAELTGKTMAEVSTIAIEFAAKHLEVVDED